MIGLEKALIKQNQQRMPQYKEPGRQISVKSAPANIFNGLFEVQISG
jgi:hypothetical protein